MIKIETFDLIDNIEYTLKPTMFPDGTSQVWNLPKEICNSLNTKVTWNFEKENELIDIASLSFLISGNRHLHIPYLPYARQDKPIDNKSTFNLHVFAKILNSLEFNLVTAVDVHNPKETSSLINNFKNYEMMDFLPNLIQKNEEVLFPDSGALKRYEKLQGRHWSCNKTRNQKTGEITNLEIIGMNIKAVDRIFIVDDICDGGATFINIAKKLKEQNSNIIIDLYVTHGIFSKGKQVLHDAGIRNIYTTNSLLKNVDGFKV